VVRELWIGKARQAIFEAVSQKERLSHPQRHLSNNIPW
jgi:hypothetical protein